MSTRNSTTVTAIRAACIGIAGLICMLMLSAGWSWAETWTVGGGSGPRALETIASAVLMASDGDTVLIYPGTYAGGVTCSKALRFTASGGPGSVVINSPGQVGLHLTGVQGRVTIESLRFSNGSGQRGGAILIESVTQGVVIQDCIFDHNSATGSGGAIDAWGAVVTIDGCLFVNNEAVTIDGAGGAVVLWASATGSVISNCVFTGNWAPAGGAIYYTGDITITDCRFTENSAGFDGGAIVSDSPEGSTIRACLFAGNSSNLEGGAIRLSEGFNTIQDCTFDGNTSAKGGDIFLAASDNDIENCTFHDSEGTTAGGALYFTNVGGTVMKCIFAKASSSSRAIYVADGGSPGFECNCFYGNAAGDFSNFDDQIGINGNFQLDPLFCGASSGGVITDGNFRLQSHSPCAPGNVPGGCVGPIGACGVGCGTSLVETGSWGQIKARFK